jgi:hypothetical protein
MNQVHELNFFFYVTVQTGSVAHRASYLIGMRLFPRGEAARAQNWYFTSNSAEIKSEWSHTSALPTYFYGMERDKFTIYLHPTILSKILQTPLQLELHSISNLQHMIYMNQTAQYLCIACVVVLRIGWKEMTVLHASNIW